MSAQLSVGDTLSEAWGLYSKFFGRLVMIAAAVYLGLGLVSAGAAQLASGGGFGRIALSAVGGLVSLVGFFWVQGALVEATADMRDGVADLGIGQVYHRVLPLLGSLILAGILAGIGIVIGAIALFVPGLFLLTIWSMLAPVIVLEKAPTGQAFTRSRQLVRGNGWSVFGLIVLLVIANLVVASVINSIFVSVAGEFVGVWLGSAVTNSLLVPFFAVALTVAYFRLSGRAAPGSEVGTAAL
jgi:hypothetical protein